jgi:hypothetical protein
MEDVNGREYAKLSDLKEGDIVELDRDFSCMSGIVEIFHSDDGLYFVCIYGRHYLIGQMEADGSLTGIYPT